jgi:hypothetical protein
MFFPPKVPEYSSSANPRERTVGYGGLCYSRSGNGFRGSAEFENGAEGRTHQWKRVYQKASFITGNLNVENKATFLA